MLALNTASANHAGLSKLMLNLRHYRQLRLSSRYLPARCMLYLRLKAKKRPISKTMRRARGVIPLGLFFLLYLLAVHYSFAHQLDQAFGRSLTDPAIIERANKWLLGFLALLILAVVCYKERLISPLLFLLVSFIFCEAAKKILPGADGYPPSYPSGHMAFGLAFSIALRACVIFFS